MKLITALVEDKDAETVVGLLAGVALDLKMSTPEPNPAKKPAKRKIVSPHRVKGQTASDLVVGILTERGPTAKSVITQLLEGQGYAEKTGGACLSTMWQGGLVERRPGTVAGDVIYSLKP